MSIISKFGKRNTNFQIAYFLAGQCHTADGAYFVLKDLLNEREGALKAHEVAKLHAESKKAKLEEAMEHGVPLSKELELKADVLNIENEQESINFLKSQTEDEVSFIKKCIEAISPHRKYGNHAESYAHEMSQREEWLLELRSRIENQLITTGAISPDDMETYRSHPDFATILWPYITAVKTAIADKNEATINKLMQKSVTANPVLKYLHDSQVISLPSLEYKNENV